MRKIQTIKLPFFFDVIPLSNADNVFTAQKYHCLSPFEIIKKITCFLRLELCFEAGRIFSFLKHKTLTAIITSFFANFFQ